METIYNTTPKEVAIKFYSDALTDFGNTPKEIAINRTNCIIGVFEIELKNNNDQIIQDAIEFYSEVIEEINNI